MDPHAWGVARSRASTPAEFAARVLDLASLVKDSISSTRAARITLQAEAAILNATVRLDPRHLRRPRARSHPRDRSGHDHCVGQRRGLRPDRSRARSA